MMQIGSEKPCQTGAQGLASQVASHASSVGSGNTHKQRTDQMEIKNLKIETIEEVDGNTLCPYWEGAMFLVNGKYVAAPPPRDHHNINKKPFDLKIGEDVEVITQRHEASDTVWIARN